MLGVFASGPSTVKGARELRYKETDRISAVVGELKWVKIDEFEDGFTVHPGFLWS